MAKSTKTCNFVNAALYAKLLPPAEMSPRGRKGPSKAARTWSCLVCSSNWGENTDIGVHCPPLSSQTVALPQTHAGGAEFQGSGRHFPPGLISLSRARRGLRPKAIKAGRQGDRISVYVCIVGQMVNILTSTLTLNTHYEPGSVLHVLT